jgi:hypothetical protein
MIIRRLLTIAPGVVSASGITFEQQTLAYQHQERYRANVLEFVRGHFGILIAFDPREDADRFFASAWPHR